MFVKDCMTRHPILVGPKMSAAEAQELMVDNNVRHMPVVADGKRLLGLITRQRLMLNPESLGSLNIWEIGRFVTNLTLDKLMIKRANVYTIDEGASIEWASNFLTEYKIGCLPVVDKDDVVVGIITETDILMAFQEMLGMPASGVRVTMRIPDQQNEFVKLMAVIAENKWGVMGIGTYPSPRRPGFYDVVMKVRRVEIDQAKEILSRVPDQSVVDIRQWRWGEPDSPQT